jgi:hypothetical protein
MMEESIRQHDQDREDSKTPRMQRLCSECGQLFQPAGRWDNRCSQSCEGTYQRDPFDYKCTDTFRDYGATFLGLSCLSGRRPVHDAEELPGRARMESHILEVMGELRRLPLKLKAMEVFKPLHRHQSTDSSQGFFEGIGSGDAA